MSEFMHEASAVLEPEPLPHGRGPEDVERFHDDVVTRAYPPPGASSVQTPDGWKTVRKPPPPGSRFFGLWGETPSKAAQSSVVAAETAADPLAVPPIPISEAGSAKPCEVVDDNPSRERWNVLRIKTPWKRRLAMVAIGFVAFWLLVVVGAAAFVARIVEALWNGVCDLVAGLWGELLAQRRQWRLAWAAMKLGWRGE